VIGQNFLDAADIHALQPVDHVGSYLSEGIPVGRRERIDEQSLQLAVAHSLPPAAFVVQMYFSRAFCIGHLPAARAPTKSA
jgi:hypothetical protein